MTVHIAGTAMSRQDYLEHRAHVTIKPGHVETLERHRRLLWSEGINVEDFTLPELDELLWTVAVVEGVAVLLFGAIPCTSFQVRSRGDINADYRERIAEIRSRRSSP